MYFVRGRAISGFFGFFGIFCYFFAGGEDSPSSIFKNRRWNQHRVRSGLKQNLKMWKKSGDLRHHLLGRYWRPSFLNVFFVFACSKWTFLKVNYWFFPKDIFFGSVWALSVGVCEMWTTWLCGPVAVPAHPRILAGRQSRRISGQQQSGQQQSGEQQSGEQGSCGISGDPILSTQRIPRSADPILSTQRIPRGWDMIVSTQRVS